MKRFSEMRGSARWAVIGSVALAVAFGLLVCAGVVLDRRGADDVIKGQQAFDKSMESVRRGRDIFSSTDELDGTKTYGIAVVATKGDGRLMIGCSSLKDLFVCIDFHSIVEPNGQGRSDIRLRLDGRPPVREWWGESGDYTTVFAPDPQKLIRDLRAARTLMFEHARFQGGREVATFDLTDIKTGLLKLVAACGAGISLKSRPEHGSP
ncbi:MAG: hypothetical protein WBQ65_26840 [Bryobacteraceae bacterium]